MDLRGQEKLLKKSSVCKVANEEARLCDVMDRTKLGIFVAALMVGGIGASLGVASAQERVRIAWAALNPAASPMWVVQEKRLAEKTWCRCRDYRH